jgi:peptidoglycan/LPS O-acetylase OafA/YrhL
MIKLADVARDRDNNFNLIRFLAAFAVLIDHGLVLATGSATAYPLYTTFGLTWGDIAVDVFFVTSGFLVTASLLNRRSSWVFAWARALRILPALWMMLALTVFGVGLALTSYTPSAYLSAHGTWRYLLENAVLIHGTDFKLPGLFQHNPYRNAVNGSLWTLPFEIEMYGLLLALWIVAALGGSRRVNVLRCAVLAAGASAGFWYLSHQVFGDASIDTSRFAFMFFAGAGFCVLKEQIRLYGSVVIALIGATLLCVFSPVFSAGFFLMFNLSLPYLLIYGAYAGGARLRGFNRIGDYSYGIYIYAFLTQQTIVCLMPGISAWSLIGLSAIATLALAIVSWHLIEKRALSLRPARLPESPGPRAQRCDSGPRATYESAA